MWEYLLIFILSATPWIEILFVIPLAIAAGLHPLPVALVAFMGNFLPIVAITYFYDQWEQWRMKRKRRHDTNPEEDVIQHHESKRKKLGRKIWDKCGLPGLALLSPIVTGAHLAAVIALLSRSPRASILFWMFCSLVIWTVILTAGTHCGLDFFGLKFE
jgi:Ca2+/H+ antiporter, TMEM165/GDT1 family